MIEYRTIFAVVISVVNSRFFGGLQEADNNSNLLGIQTVLKRLKTQFSSQFTHITTVTQLCIKKPKYICNISYEN